MKIYACSDLHVSPEVFLDQTRIFLEEAAANADMTLLLGDIFEGSWFPLQESVEHPNGQELWKLIKAQKTPLLVRGNHDWTLEKYIQDPQVKIHTNHKFEADGVKYYATHGWAEYDVPLGRLAPFYDTILPILSLLAKYWSKLKTPGKFKRGERTLVYWHKVRALSNRAIYHAMKMSKDPALEDVSARRVPIWGHTHHRHLDDYEHWLAINCGDFVEPDGGGIVIEDGVPRPWAVS
jgi:UDP-2,3-diacylglucosamine pyrophosphatase LpxH